LNARQLLDTITERGGVVTVAHHGDTVKIQIAPRGLVSDLASYIQRFKPALVELLAPDDEAAARNRVRPEIRRAFPGADVLTIGRLLLRLDSGEEIE
jgi:hypothetical protein